MRTVVVVLEAELLQMREQVLTDVVNDVLRDLDHYAGPQQREYDAEHIRDCGEDNQYDQITHIFLRDGFVQRFLHEHRRKEHHYARDAAEEDRQSHLFDVFFDI